MRPLLRPRARAPLSLLAVLVVAGTVAAVPSAPAAGRLSAPLADADGRIAAAVDAALEGWSWLAVDLHLHTDHSHDAGLAHQQSKSPANHDTFLDEQRDQAIRMGMDAVTFTDHRTFDQHYSSDYRSDDAILLTGEEWGSGRHGTALGLVEVLENGPTSRTGCGVAEMTFEAAAQDGLLGIAHPKDGVPCIDLEDFAAYPMSHIEALRGGDNALQEAGLLPGGNGSNSAYYAALLGAGGRVAAVNGSDNHFKQVWASPGGPGTSATYALVRERTETGLREAIRERRTIAGLDVAKPRAVTLLDADRDGEFDALTGGWAQPAGDTVTVAVRVELGTGFTLQLRDDADRLVAEEPVVLPDQVLAFDLPAASRFYRAVVTATSATQVGLPDPLDYVDTLAVVSTPVWTTAPPVHGAEPALASGPAQRLSDADWSGFPAVARAGDVVHAAWQERRGARHTVAYARSLDGGATWAAPVVLGASGAARLPAVAVEGHRVVVVWEEHRDGRLGGDLVAVSSDDAGASFGPVAVVAAGNATRPDVALAGGVAHLTWTEQGADGAWTVRYRRGDAPAVRLSSAAPRVCCQATWAVPPRTVVHVPAAVNPAIAVRDGTVVVAWEDNRDDPTPLRNGTPDDWGIWTATSTDGGRTFGADTRATPRRVARDDGSPEGLQGNPARSADVVIASDGAVLLAFSDPSGSGAGNVWVQRRDGGTWADPVLAAPASAEWAHRPQLLVDQGAVRLVWQASQDPTWHLAAASSADGGRTFGPAERVTTAGRYAGWPAVADGVVVFTAESPEGFGAHAGVLG